MRNIIIGSLLTIALVLLAACAQAPAAPAQPAATQAPAATQVPSSGQATQPASQAAPPVAGAVKGGDFKEVNISDAKSFQPYLTVDGTSASYQGNVYASGLWTYDPKTLEPTPSMAESWDVSPDGQTFTFHLRKDLKWSDGTPLTARDFEWTYQQASNPANKFPYLDNLKDIVSYKALDDYTIEAVMGTATCTGLAVADAVAPLPKHIWEKLDWSDPTKNPEIQNPTVVSGAYKLQEWRRDDHATFARNDLYFRGVPYLNTDTVRIVPNTSVQFQMLKSGEIDYAPVTASDYAEAKKVDILQEYNWDPAAARYTFLGFNLRRPFLQDVEVRHALSYAIPRQAIADKVFNGLAKPTFSDIAPSSWAYNPDVPKYDYDMDTAKATLANAGYKLDANGKLLDKSGAPVTLKIYFNQGNNQREQIVTIAQQQFKQLGMDATVTGLEFQAYLDFLSKPPFDYDMWIGGWSTTIDPYFGYQIWAESSIPDLNSGAYVNKQVEALFDQANRPPCDTASRKKVFQQIQQAISTDSPYIFLAYSVGYAFLNKRVIPNDPTSLGINYYPERWFIKTP
jgi:peptide/nickel transport system substrate-binding protein